MKHLLTILALGLLISPIGANAATKQVPHKATTTKKRAVQPARPALSNFTFRGNHIGDPAEDVIHRSIQVGPPPGSKTIFYNKEETVNNCLQGIPETGEGSCTDMYPDLSLVSEYRDRLSIMYLFYNRKFYGFEMSFQIGRYPEIKTMLISRYGSPYQTLHDQVENGMGAKFDQEILVWQTDHGPMTLYYRLPDVNTSILTLKDNSVEALIAAKEKQKFQQRAKTAF